MLVENALRQLIASLTGLADLHETRMLLRRVHPCRPDPRHRAGAGCPSIEPGMPLPAGTGLTRREFVARSVGLALSVYGAGPASQLFDEGIANAATGRHSPILVCVFLQGGADSLSLLYPQGDPLYQKLRPTSRSPAGTAFTEDAAPLLAPGARAARTCTTRAR